MANAKPKDRDYAGLVAAVLAGDIDRSEATLLANRWNELQRAESGPRSTTEFESVVSRLNAGEVKHRESGPPFFFRDSDLREWLLIERNEEQYRVLSDTIIQFRLRPPTPTWRRSRELPLLASSLGHEQLRAKIPGLFLLRGIEDGLGYSATANLLVDGERVRVRWLAEASPEFAVSVAVVEREGATFDQFRCVIEAFSLDDDEITWANEACGLNVQRRWRIVRQDDNGNVFDVTTKLSRARAVQIAEEFESRGHKQSYSVV